MRWTEGTPPGLKRIRNMRSHSLEGSSGPDWLVGIGGSRDSRHALESDVHRIGRDPSRNDIAPEGPGAEIVSATHAEIRSSEEGYRIVDTGSRNGTYLDGVRVEEALLTHGSIISLGKGGPEFRFEKGDETAPAVDETVLESDFRQIPVESASPDLSVPEDPRDDELIAAVQQARRARESGESGQTVMIMRDVLTQAVRKSDRRHRTVIGILGTVMLIFAVWAFWTIRGLGQQKDQVDSRINEIEVALASTQDPAEIDTYVAELGSLQEQAREIQRSLLYRLGTRDRNVDFIEEEILQLMSELGAQQYSIPPLFRERVKFYIERYCGPGKPNLDRALRSKRPDLEVMRAEFQNARIPGDLALIALVESAFRWRSVSKRGAAGPWQLVPATAKAYGLKVEEGVDERFEVLKSSRAAARYIRHLIFEFGAGDSVMLALAAYNLGPARVKRVLRKVDDPIRQRDFWYLYRTRALPRETREYIPKIVAAILIARNPEQFGLDYEPLT